MRLSSRWLFAVALLTSEAAAAGGGGGGGKSGNSTGTEHCVTADQGSVAWGQEKVEMRLNLGEQEMARLNQSLASGDYPDAELDGTTLTVTRDLLCRNMTRSQAARLLDRELQEAPWSQEYDGDDGPRKAADKWLKWHCFDVCPPIGSGQRHCSCHAGGHHGSHGPKAPGRDLLQ